MKAALYGAIAAIVARRTNDTSPLVALGGAQGAGKSTLCRQLAQETGAACFSLDDVYLTRSERQRLAETVHPLFLTRGPPGTHDLALAQRTIAALYDATPTDETPLPHFDKATDDRAPQSEWPRFRGRPAVILVEGWCMGARAPDLHAPRNALEHAEDADGRWRRHQHAALQGAYADFFGQFKQILYLQAPNFEIVRRWRGQQEETMLGRAMTEAERARLDRFIAHYEWVTRSMLDGHLRADWIVQLDEQRNVLDVAQR